MQRFLRQPMQGVTLSTLVGVYRAVMRLSAIADAMDDTIEGGSEDVNEAESGPVLLRSRIISPLQQVVLMCTFRVCGLGCTKPSLQPSFSEMDCFLFSQINEQRQSTPSRHRRDNTSPSCKGNDFVRFAPLSIFHVGCFGPFQVPEPV